MRRKRRWGGGEGDGGPYKTQHITCMHITINGNEKKDEETDCEMDSFVQTKLNV